MAAFHLRHLTIFAFSLVASGLFFLGETCEAQSYATSSGDSYDGYSAPSERSSGPSGLLPLEEKLIKTSRTRRRHLHREPGRFRNFRRGFFEEVQSDYCNYYSFDSLAWQGIFFGGGAILANTSLDQDFRDWVQDDVRCDGTDNCSSFFNPLGDGRYMVPIFAGLALARPVLERIVLGRPLGEYSSCVTRGYLVGMPLVLLMQSATGGSRPGEKPYNSEWRFFADTNGVSGHAFIGAVPFITLAQRTRSPLLKATFYTLSAFPACARVNYDHHYLSQALLGWMMAYYATTAVSETDFHAKGHFRYNLAPIIAPGMQGMALQINY